MATILSPRYSKSRNGMGYLRRRKHHGYLRYLILGSLFMMGVAFSFIYASDLFKNSNQLYHTVQVGENLSTISSRYQVSVDQLKLANKLDDSEIKADQKLFVPQGFYIVSSGDNLFSIAKELDTSEKTILRLNNKSEQDYLRKGEKLRVPTNPTIGQTYTVESGDTLSRIALMFNLSQAKLIKYNDLEEPSLKTGQTLQLTSNRPLKYVVDLDDTLYSLAKDYNISVDQLMQYNALNTTTLKVGQELTLFNPIYNELEEREYKLLDKEVNSSKTSYVKKEASYLAKQIPSMHSQPSFSYQTYEDERFTANNHKKALKILAKIDEEALANPINNKLKGYTIVLDSGHGGNDPGAIVRRKQGDKSIYFVEDEYAYDVTIRLYRLLKRHGANVVMTNLSPDHAERDSLAEQTFINNKNEVLNDSSKKTRLQGGKESLYLRRELINHNFFARVKKDKRIFISIHLDSSPDTPLGLVAVSENPSDESQQLANAIIKSNGRGELVKEPLIIVSKNEAMAAVLVEVRNMAKDEVASFSNYKNRQKDAENIVQGVLNYTKNL